MSAPFKSIDEVLPPEGTEEQLARLLFERMEHLDPGGKMGKRRPSVKRCFTVSALKRSLLKD
jgi:hypothetical protein